MPGLVTGRKRSSVALSDEDEQSDVSHQSAKSKRARRTRDASDGASSTNGQHRLSHDYEDVHQPGSLVRVKLTNFVTYTAAEFHLGPSLNMIIGPNGTGKSTLVCAICLGLGWSPSNLGRAKEIGEFVKHDSAEAEIEIELAASEMQTENPVIRRIIRKEGNKSAFFINQRPQPQKEVLALARSFSIQIDNLCQFLPQDRVVEFARLDPISLLRETQRAAAPEEMVKRHDDLKELRAEEKSLESQQQNEQHHLKGLQAKQNTTREDVERYNQRQELLVKSKALEKCRHILNERTLKAEVNQIKADMRTNQEELHRYETEVEPARRAESEMEGYRDQIQRISRNRKQRFDAMKITVDKLATKIDADQQSLGAFTTEISAEKHAEKQRKQEIRRIENDIIRLERSMEDNVVEYDQAPFEARKSEIRTRKSAAERKMAELANESKSMRGDVLRDRDTLQIKENERERLNTQSGQQASRLATLSRDTSDGWRWLQENMSKLSLKAKVYGPPIIECSVPDKNYADAVESQLRRGDLTAITCTNVEDAQVIQDTLLGPKKDGFLGLHDITIRTILHPRSWYRSPMTQEELANFGFEGWISDVIQGPDAVLAMLCDSAKLHRTAFASRSISNEQYNALQRGDQISRWVGGSEVYQITRRREYGVSSTSVNPLKKAQYFTGQAVATTEMTQLDEEIKEIRRNIALKAETQNAKKAQYQEAQQQAKEAEHERAEVQAEQDRIKKAHAEWQGLPRKIAAKEVSLEAVKRLSDESHGRIKAIQSEHERASLKVAALTLEYAKAVTQLRSVHESYIEAEIRLLEATSEVAGYKDDNRQILDALEQRRATIEELKIAKETKSTEHRKTHEYVYRLLKSLAGQEKEIVREYKDLESIEELENEIAAVSSRLNLMAEANPHAVKAFEEREQKIHKVQQTLDEVEQKLAHARHEIERIRNEWEPELDALVAKISDGFAHNFQQIGCAGQVSVYKDEDFENWSIQIQVCFREGESLAVLDSHRQSGGERAVSTIFYLMALQDLARSPFRVVDEINQGMDPRNERMVHERMVDIACRERTSQYFLITPKLLNGLKFHPKMKVHCIASGEYMPDKHTNLDFRSLAELALRVRRKAITAA
ncbi:Structural maintenance of chromosomes protein 5 [Kalmusia sp. IMI 367209]|nr:Structural maintenance of chromosomes protein 5 [Kalmusia sp. IMI 367209]